MNPCLIGVPAETARIPLMTQQEPPPFASRVNSFVRSDCVL